MTVMFMGAIVYGVRYTIPEYLCTFLVAGGVSVFALFKVIMANLFIFHQLEAFAFQ
jgi:hypothetical protein